MGRAKIAMEFISKEKARNTTYLKRRKGLIKKGHEFSILCNVPICIIIYPYKEGSSKQSSNPEVYSFLRCSSSTTTTSSLNLLDLARARDPELAREIIDRYLSVPKEEKSKRTLNLYDMFDEWKRKADQELSKLRHKNALAKYPTWNSTLDGLNSDQLVELLVHLDQKIETLRQRIAMIKGSQVGNLIPFVDHHHHQHNHNQIGCIDVEVLNRFSLFNYPVSSTGQDCNQLVPLDPNGFTEQMAVDQNNNLVMYNMNMMGMDPVYYDQGSGIVDREAVASSYGGGSLPAVSMPLQLPMMSNVPLTKQLQMFYK